VHRPDPVVHVGLPKQAAPPNRFGAPLRVSVSLWLIFFVCFVSSCLRPFCAFRVFRGGHFADRIRDLANSFSMESRMHFLHVLLVSTIAFFQTSPLSTRIGRSDFVLVKSVTDGDTIARPNSRSPTRRRRPSTRRSATA